jgi:hypothetical protein
LDSLSAGRRRGGPREPVQNQATQPPDGIDDRLGLSLGMGLKLREDRRTGRPTIKAEMRLHSARVNPPGAGATRRPEISLHLANRRVEATSGIEPEYTDLQSAA